MGWKRRNIASGVLAVLVILAVYGIEGRDLFGFVYVFSAWAGAATFSIVWSSLTLGVIVRSRARKALFELRTWVAILALCFGVILAIRLAREILP